MYLKNGSRSRRQECGGRTGNLGAAAKRDGPLVPKTTQRCSGASNSVTALPLASQANKLLAHQSKVLYLRYFQVGKKAGGTGKSDGEIIE